VSEAMGTPRGDGLPIPDVILDGEVIEADCR
jgi:hypothetical protein